MRVGQVITVYHDGKLCRGVEAIVLDKRAQGLKLSFQGFDEEVVTWFRRRTKGGKYEAIGYNYFVLED